MSEATDGLVLVAVGIRPHGIRGELALTPMGGDPGRFAPGLAVTWRGGGREVSLTVRAVRGHGGRVLVTFEEIADRSAAEGLKGGGLWAAPTSGEELAADTYYHHQLIGLCVADEDGAELGRLSAVLEGGAHDNWEVSMADGRRFLVPAVAAFVLNVDLAGGVVTIRPAPGLIPEPGEAGAGMGAGKGRRKTNAGKGDR